MSDTDGFVDDGWMEEDETGGYVTKTIRYQMVDSAGDVTVVAKKLKVKILSGLEHGEYQAALLTFDEGGETKVDIKRGQSKLVSLSLGWSAQQIDKVKRKKPMACWSAIVEAVDQVNRVGSKKAAEAEKNGDGESSSPLSA